MSAKFGIFMNLRDVDTSVLSILESIVHCHPLTGRVGHKPVRDRTDSEPYIYDILKSTVYRSSL